MALVGARVCVPGFLSFSFSWWDQVVVCLLVGGLDYLLNIVTTGIKHTILVASMMSGLVGGFYVTNNDGTDGVFFMSGIGWCVRS